MHLPPVNEIHGSALSQQALKRLKMFPPRRGRFSKQVSSVAAGFAAIWSLLILIWGLHPAIAQGQAPTSPPSPRFSVPVLPSATDPEIRTYDFPHYVYFNRDPVMSPTAESPPLRNELLVFLPGTNGRGKADSKFLELAVQLGYHAIFLTYPTGLAAAQACRNDTDPNGLEKFRMALIAGGVSPHISITRADSIENRLAKLLRHLHLNRAAENWGQFLDLEGSLKWERVALAGQSQGGGHAALMAIKYRVARVICTGAPKDFDQVRQQPAAWYGHPSATPKTRFFAFNHAQDGMGNCTAEQQLENLRALKLDAFGAPADVDTEPPPYRNTRILRTNHPGGTVASRTAHTSVIANTNAAVFQAVWTYMLTESVK